MCSCIICNWNLMTSCRHQWSLTLDLRWVVRLNPTHCRPPPPRRCRRDSEQQGGCSFVWLVGRARSRRASWQRLIKMPSSVMARSLCRDEQLATLLWAPASGSRDLSRSHVYKTPGQALIPRVCIYTGTLLVSMATFWKRSELRWFIQYQTVFASLFGRTYFEFTP